MNFSWMRREEEERIEGMSSIGTKGVESIGDEVCYGQEDCNVMESCLNGSDCIGEERIKSLPMEDYSKHQLRPLKRRKQTTLSSFFSSKRTVSASTLEYSLEERDTTVVISPFKEGKERIAAFDLDGTLIRTQSGRTFARDATDWQFAFTENCIREKLSKLREDGYKLIVISNQLGISKGKTTAEQFHSKFRRIASVLGDSLPLHCFAACHDDLHRKPRKGLWELHQLEYNEGITIDIDRSFYVGDAAGRPERNRKKDFSCSDRKFALNVGIRFYTPEEYFKGIAEDFTIGFDPKTIQMKNCVVYPMEQQEVVVLVGQPASGKSTLCTRVFKGYVHVSFDLQSRASALKQFKSAIGRGESVVVDNTNASWKERRIWCDLAVASKVPLRCIVMGASDDLCLHLNTMRGLTGKGRKVPMVAFHVFRKRFEVPVIDEGFDSIETVDFVPQFECDTEKELFQMFL